MLLSNDKSVFWSISTLGLDHSGRWIFVKTTDAGSYMLEAFTLANNIGHMSLGGACHSVQPLDVRVGGPHCLSLD